MKIFSERVVVHPVQWPTKQLLFILSSAPSLFNIFPHCTPLSHLNNRNSSNASHAILRAHTASHLELNLSSVVANISLALVFCREDSLIQYKLQAENSPNPEPFLIIIYFINYSINLLTIKNAHLIYNN